jgi:hypothetical protein
MHLIESRFKVGLRSMQEKQENARAGGGSGGGGGG